jgi:regulatory protein
MSASKEAFKKAFIKLSWYCSRAERSIKQAKDKLDHLSLSSDQKDEIIERLLNENYLNTERFASAFCRDKFRFNKWGKRKIKAELSLRHHLTDLEIETGLATIDPVDYQEVLESLALKKIASLSTDSSLDAKSKNKVIQYLINKGFEPDLVYTLISSRIVP